MIRYFKRTLKDRKLRKIEGFEPGCWIHADNPTMKEITYLQKEFGLDRQNLVSGLDRNELPRAEILGKDIYVILKTIPPHETKNLYTLLIVITDRFVLTVSEKAPESIENIISGDIEFITTQKLKCLVTLFSLTNKKFERQTLDIVRAVNSERESVEGLTDKHINKLLEQESILNSFVSSYYYTNTVYEKIVKNVKFFEKDRAFIEDLMIEAKQGLDLCRSSLRTISNIRNSFVILLSNKLNKVISLLTIFTIFISIPAAVSGIYGMNVLLPFGSDPSIFLYILAFIVVIWAGFIAYFKKMKVL